MQENNEQPKNKPSVSSSNNKNEHKKEGFFKSHKTEFKKITWPNKKVLVKETVTVIFISLIVGLIVFAYDLGIDFIIKNLAKFVA